MNEIKRSITAYIEENRRGIIDFLKEYVGIRSINPSSDGGPGQEMEVQHWLRKKLAEFGFDQVDI